MHIDEYREHCINKTGVTEEFPFDENILVFKIMGKMFSATDVENFESINVKCDPELAVELREQYDAVIPGYHMNKRHWNTIVMDNSVPDYLVKKWIDDSYTLVVSKLPKSLKDSNLLNPS